MKQHEMGGFMMPGLMLTATGPRRGFWPLLVILALTLGGLLFLPATSMAAVKTYYVQQDGTCGSNSNSGNVWQSAAEGSSNCGSRSRIGAADASGDMLIAYTPVFASPTTVTGQTGSHIYFDEGDDGDFTGRVGFVEINAA